MGSGKSICPCFLVVLRAHFGAPLVSFLPPGSSGRIPWLEYSGEDDARSRPSSSGCLTLADSRFSLSLTRSMPSQWPS